MRCPFVVSSMFVQIDGVDCADISKYVDWLGYQYDDEESLRDEFDAVAFFGLGSNDNYGIIEHEDIS